MQLSEFEHFRDILIERQRRLADWLNTAASARVDDAAKVRQLLFQIKEALIRIENNSYGECVVCHGHVEHERLEIQPVSQICLDCISEEERVALEQDLRLASEIHRALLPQTMPVLEGIEIQSRSLAAGSVGGDYYDFLERSGDHTNRIVIGDVMGKGIRAGLLMSNLQGAMRILSTQFASPAPLLERLNTWMCRNIPVTKFISLVLLELSPADGKEARLTYTNAGHPPPIIVRRTGKIERFEVTGGILGVHEEFIYEERDVTLMPGDLLLLYTDGIVESENPHGDHFEEDRLIRFMRQHRTESPGTIIDSLLQDVLDFSGNSQPMDDMTVILLRKK